jgi:hypothetical protein
MTRFEEVEAAALRSLESRRRSGKKKSTKIEGLFKQVNKTLALLSTNPRHPGLQTHSYATLENPIYPGEKVFEAYVQHRTPGAYRIFWCYRPGKQEITILAITPHP